MGLKLSLLLLTIRAKRALFGLYREAFLCFSVFRRLGFMHKHIAFMHIVYIGHMEYGDRASGAFSPQPFGAAAPTRAEWAAAG